jgi:hypothetical protein
MKSSNWSEAVLYTLALLASLPLAALCQGLTFHIFWGWFVTPALGPPAPGVVACFGLVLLLRLASYQPKERGDEDEARAPDWASLVKPLGHTALFLVLGWVTHLFL